MQTTNVQLTDRRCSLQWEYGKIAEEKLEAGRNCSTVTDWVFFKFDLKGVALNGTGPLESNRK